MKTLSARSMRVDHSNKACSRSTAPWRHRTSAIVALISVAAGQPLWASSPASLVTKMVYDAGNNVASVTDPRGLVTTQATDGLGQRWQLVSPDTGTTNFAYDGYGRLASMTRANGVQTTYGYDSLNRQTSLSAGGLGQTFVYDTCTNGLGRLCVDGDAKGATSYSYTPEGWLAGKGFSVVVPGGKPVSYGLGYNYDFEGRLTVASYPDGNTAVYQRTQGAVSSVYYVINGKAVGGVSAITYRPMEMGMTSWTAVNGLTTTVSYDNDGRLTGISVPGTQNLGFNYDTANRLHQITNGIDSTLSQIFSYDAQSQLNSVTSGADNESYNYDADGNRINWITNGSTYIEGYSATNNQLDTVSGPVSFGYGYDANGNTTNIVFTPEYHYDAFNRMDTSASGASYYVNPEGQRLSKTGGSTGSNYFAPDASGAMLAESQGNGWTDYVWLNGRLVGRIANGQVYAVHADQIGRPESVTDANKTVVWRAKNFPFTQTVSLANIPLNLGFPGQYYDTETGTWNNGYRDYNSGLGRYLESDPIGLGGGTNTYTYAGSDPLDFVDPLGLSTLTFDRAAGTLTITDANGNVTSVQPAANNAQHHSRGAWPDGAYSFDRNRAHPDDAPNSAYGSNGNTIFNVPGCTGCGVHSGRASSKDRAGRSGVNFATNGCIRTTDAATTTIRNLQQSGDPVTSLTVVN